MTNLILGTILLATNTLEVNPERYGFEFYDNMKIESLEEHVLNFGLGPELGFYLTNAVTRELVTNDQAVLEVFTLRLRWGDDPIVRRKTNVLSRSVNRFRKKETWEETP